MQLGDFHERHQELEEPRARLEGAEHTCSGIVASLSRSSSPSSSIGQDAPSMSRRTIPRPPYRAARAFYLTLFIGVCFATYALLAQPNYTPSSGFYPTVWKRESEAAPNDDEQCRLVHQAKDQCAFVHAQCPDDEAGFTAYLDLYYCRLAHVKPIAFIILISWLGLLFSTIGIAASDFFCINLSTIATILGMSESMAGVTFLAFGNGSPDVFSTFAAMSTNSGSLALGELFGAAGFITAVVSGSMALIRPFQVARKSFVRDVGFFVVATSFSLVFLWDGKLHFWECIAMVVYYCFYVAFVVVWHWYLNRRRRRREREAAIRGHYIPPEEHDSDEEIYRDDPDESSASPGRPSPGARGISREDWSALERGGGDGYEDESMDEDEEEEARDRWLSELNSNMRLTRVPARARKNTTLTPVRPSLMGALEFQAVLKSLQKSRNIQTYPMNARRYSDDPTYTTAQQQDHLSSTSDPAARPPYQLTVHDNGETPTMERTGFLEPHAAPVRNRAASADGAQGLAIDPEIQRLSRERSRSPEPDLIMFNDGNDLIAGQRRRDTLEVPGSLSDYPSSPSVQISPATPRRHAPINDRRSSTRSVPRSPDLLAPPDEISTPYRSGDIRGKDGTQQAPSAVPHARQLPKITIPGRERSSSQSPLPSPRSSPFLRYRDSPSAPFPRYQDDVQTGTSRTASFQLPPPASPESLPLPQGPEHPVHQRPTLIDRWWPFSVLPPPEVMFATLFPTIYQWGEKNYWEKALGVVAAPSVFFLTITLPVVEGGKEGNDLGPAKDTSFDSATSKTPSRGTSVPIKHSGTGIVLNDPVIHIQEHGGLSSQGAAGQGTTTANVATAVEQNGHRPSMTVEQAMSLTAEPEQEELPELWNRWLLIVQLFLAPLFIVFAIYSQTPMEISSSWLVQPVLICLLISLVLLIPLLLTTTPSHKPAVYRYILSLVGFTVSIAWISTIASQVVGALKALAVILNMSHAIMGLTIFAVGNSLGDLVADVTVAKLGYPVMALSACFGGPMLNILLGIGLSGSYILLRGAETRDHKHPGKHLKFKSYHIEVSNTLIVSGVTLLVTLLGLLIFVPMNKWVFSKRIGWTLIAVWILSTIGNVVIEVTGLAEDDMFRLRH